MKTRLRHVRYCVVMILGGIALAATLALVAPGDSMGWEAPWLMASTIYVDADATGANDGSSWPNAYTTLQPALDEATAGDEIWVAAGTYKPTNQWDPIDPRTATFQLKNEVALYGGFDPTVGDVGFGDRDWAANVTTLSGNLGSPNIRTDNSYNVFYHPAALALDATAVLDGFVIADGYAHSQGHQRGGGMYNEDSSPTIRNCTFNDNSAGYGGGMANYDSSSPSVTDCVFLKNESDFGGGMANYDFSSPTVTHCSFVDNDAIYNNGHGAGMLNDQYSSPTVSNCTFVDNKAFTGGGMDNYTGSSPIVTNCTFIGNFASAEGGGLRNYSAGAPVVTNCTFWDNSSPLGAGIYNRYTELTVTNCILWGDTPHEVDFVGTAPVINYSDVQGDYAGTANINEDPQLEDPANGDFHLLASSPCIDAGTNDAPNLPVTDFEGDPRIWDGDLDGTATADIGVDEFGFLTLAVHTAGNGGGTVDQSPPGTRVPRNTLVTLTAVPRTGSYFTGWSGDASGTDNPTTLTMDTDKVVTAAFATHRIYVPLVERRTP